MKNELVLPRDRAVMLHQSTANKIIMIIGGVMLGFTGFFLFLMGLAVTGLMIFPDPEAATIFTGLCLGGLILFSGALFLFMGFVLIYMGIATVQLALYEEGIFSGPVKPKHLMAKTIPVTPWNQILEVRMGVQRTSRSAVPVIKVGRLGKRPFNLRMDENTAQALPFIRKKLPGKVDKEVLIEFGMK